MEIELSDITFTEQDDVVPASGVEEIVNTGVANTFTGNDKIIGTGETLRAILFYSLYTVGIYNKSNGTIYTDNGDDEITGYGNIGIYNESNGTINTGNGRDKITGYGSQTDSSALDHTGVLNEGIINTDSGDDTISGYATGDYPGGVVNVGSIDAGNGDDIIMGDGLTGGVTNGRGGTIDTGNGDDTIIGTSAGERGTGIYTGGFDESGFATINTGNGDDSIIGTSSEGNNSFGISVVAKGEINTDNGNDSIIGTGYLGGIICLADGIINTGDGDDTLTGVHGIAIGRTWDVPSSKGSIKTGKGNDVITGTYVSNDIFGTIDTDADNDSIICEVIFINRGNVFLGEGNDSIAANSIFDENTLENFGFIGTGDGNDIITSTGIIYNEGFIETGNGDDSIIADGAFDLISGTTYGIYNNGGAINMGDGNDSIISNEGFRSAPNSSGAWFLGEGEDYIKGYGSGDFYGGNGNDTLELTPGTYTVGIWGEGGESPIFTKGDQLMITSEFEKLKAGSTIYDFTSLTAGQIIVVA
jgi:hypothetical protein